MLRKGVSVFKQFAQTANCPRDLFSLIPFRLYQGLKQRPSPQGRKLVAYERRYLIGRMNSRNSAVARILLTFNQPMALKPVQDSAHRGMRQSHFVAEIFNTDSILPDHNTHDRYLRRRQWTAGDLSLNGSMHRATDRVQIAFDSGGLNRVTRALDPLYFHNIPGISAFTRDRYRG